MKAKYILLLCTCVISLTACNENKFLEEEPMSFYAPDNSYETASQLQQAVNYLYSNFREIYFQPKDDGYQLALFVSTDLFWWSWGEEKYNNYSAWVNPTYSYASSFWNNLYSTIVNANEILYRLDQTESVSEEQKKVFRGEALFFRGFAYRYLANVYGGVPIETEHRTIPRRDYVRATRQETWQQSAKDLEEAISLLPDITETKDGKVSKQAAQHLISEVYISLGEYDKAVTAATAVLSHNKIHLMTSRFGVDANKEGDVYYDLFRNGNINRSEGNEETILAWQFEYNNAGSPCYDYSSCNFLPRYRSAHCAAADGNGTVLAFSPSITAEKGGRGQGGLEMSYFLKQSIWGKDFDNDMRNSKYNIIRDVIIDNPKAAGYGQHLVADGWLVESDTVGNFFPIMWKVTGNFPDASYAKNSDGSYKLSAFGEHELIHSGPSARATYRDGYCFRAAETYLLRAEAYLGKGDKQKAADDINAVRSRANATPVTASEVDIDYILDERGRELVTEEQRAVTLFRLGKFVERSRKYSVYGSTVGDWQNLWPIPYSEIERNTAAVLEQNPGY